MWNDDAFNDEQANWDTVSTDESINFQHLPIKKNIDNHLPETSIGKYFQITPTLNKALSLKKALDPSKSISEHICSALETYLKDELVYIKKFTEQTSNK